MNTIKVFPIADRTIVRPLWSVIIPTFNCARYLKQTIESVLLQDRGIENMEIWVVDDSSIDNTADMVEELGKGRIKFYRQKENVGQLQNFNTALNLSRGRLIHLLHGDDFVHDGFYKSLEAGLLSDDSVGAGFTGYNIVDEKCRLIVNGEPIASEAGVLNDFLSLITRKQVIQTPSIVVKREVYEQLGGFHKELTWIEDWEMWIRIANNYNFYHEPSILSSYRVHNSSNTSDSIGTGRFIRDVLNCIRICSSYIDITDKEKGRMRNAVKQHFLDFAYNHSNDRKDVVILIRSFSLVYNASSFFVLTSQIIKVFIKSLFKYFSLNK